MTIFDPQELLMEDLYDFDPNYITPYERICDAIYNLGFVDGSVKTGNCAPYSRSDFQRIWEAGYADGVQHRETDKAQS